MTRPANCNSHVARDMVKGGGHRLSNKMFPNSLGDSLCNHSAHHLSSCCVCCIRCHSPCIHEPVHSLDGLRRPAAHICVLVSKQRDDTRQPLPHLRMWETKGKKAWQRLKISTAAGAYMRNNEGTK